MDVLAVWRRQSQAGRGQRDWLDGRMATFGAWVDVTLHCVMGGEVPALWPCFARPKSRCRFGFAWLTALGSIYFNMIMEIYLSRYSILHAYAVLYNDVLNLQEQA
jgi:hypothetical protein